MTKEQIANFNYRAFLKLVILTPKLLRQVKALGYNPQNDIFIDLGSPYLNLNGKFKSALLKVYRDNFEAQSDKELTEVLERFNEKFPLINGRNYKSELRRIETDMADEIKRELKRLNRTFTRDDDESLEFMTYDSTSDIKEIYPDGTVKYSMIDEPISIDSLLDNGDLLPYDAASLVEELTVLK